MDADYKIEMKRVRIVIQNEDLFTILADAISETKYQSLKV